jgi:hypothetical protein
VYLHFAQALHGVVMSTASPPTATGGVSEDFNELDIWSAFEPPEPARAG